MITFVVFAIAATVALLLYAALRTRRRVSAQRIVPVDLQAFVALTDRADEFFLREKLPPARFRRLKRERIRVALGYIRRISGNAAAVLQLSEAARHSQDQDTAVAAGHIAEVAGQLRLLCIQASFKLGLEFAMPSLQLTPAMLEVKYQILRDSVAKLGKVQAAGSAQLPIAI
jgi:hypothetical protein